jgi:tetratricopeptide (TPR) repeat protein
LGNHDLAALANFFTNEPDKPEQRWMRTVDGLDNASRAKLQSMVGFRLRNAAKFSEAAGPMEDALLYYESQHNYVQAADEAGNLAVLYVHAGKLPLSFERAQKALRLAKRSDNWERISGRYATLGEVLVYFGPGKHEDAFDAFRRAEKLQSKNDRKHPILFSTKGYRYHELLLEVGKYDEVLRRTETAKEWRTERYELLDGGLLKLMRGRAFLLRARANGTDKDLEQAREQLEQALSELELAGFQENFIRGLLGQAEYFGTDMVANAEAAESVINKAWEIANRGPMPLFLVDILITRIRVFGMGDRPSARYPWLSLQADITDARRLIAAHRYQRRERQIEEAESYLARANM